MTDVVQQRSPPRLNMNHGFLKCIIRNQIERDEYNKAVNLSRAERDQQYLQMRVNQKKAANVYIPPHLREMVSNQPSASASDKEPVCDSPPSPEASETPDRSLAEDPHQEMRLRARKKLVREGVLQIPSDFCDKLSSLSLDR